MSAQPNNSQKAVSTDFMIRRWADVLGVAPVLALSDIKGEVDPNFSVDWCRERGVVVMRDGTVLCSRQDIHLQVKKIVQEKGGYARVSIRPATLEVINAKLVDLNAAGSESAAIETQSEVRQKIEAIIWRAAAEGASDIHLISQPDGTKVKFVIHGLSREFDTLTAKMGKDIANVLFNVARDAGSGPTIYNPRETQHCAMVTQLGQTTVRLRLQSLPAHPEGSLHLVLRLLLSANAAKAAKLDDLGYTDEHLKLMRGAAAKVHGIFLVAGPTASGKSTTLSAMIPELPRNEQTYTIEDPIEYELPGVTQIPAVNEEGSGRTFADLSRALLRAAPRNIMIGEIRDEATARNAVQLAMTGHRVFSTVHADSSRNIVTRLVELGIGYTTLSDPDLLVALMYQRLVPKVCPHCAISFDRNLTTIEQRRPNFVMRVQEALSGATRNVRLRNPRGCNFCKNSGAIGRTVVAEVIYLDTQGRTFIREGRLAEWEEYLLKSGWTPLRLHLLNKVQEGVVCPIDAEKQVLGSLAEAMIGSEFNYSTEINKLGDTDHNTR